MILLDTSAIYALADDTDLNHRRAVQLLDRVRREGRELCTHTYVLSEAFALIHRRHEFAAAARMSDETRSLTTIVVDRELHDRAVSRMRDARTTRSSLVDAVSFLVMGDRGIEEAFAFDDDFARAGFRLYGGEDPKELDR